MQFSSLKPRMMHINDGIHFCYAMLQGCRNRGGGAEDASSPTPTLDFGRLGYPALTRGAEYASHKVLIAPPSIFRPSAIPVLSSVSVLLVAMDG